MIDSELILAAHDKLDNGFWDGQGSTCQFYRLNDKIGIKSYRSLKDAEHTFKMQQLFCRYGLAPAVYNIVRFHRGRYWYFTQATESIRKLVPIWKVGVDSRGHSCSFKELVPIREKFYKLGVDMADDIPGNWGVIDNRIVCIDFGYLILEPKNTGKKELCSIN